jgi:hypothetical protein
MKVATVYSACECQARLGAELAEGQRLLRGFAVDPRRRATETAPVTLYGAGSQRFDIGWACPFCTRNVLRMFDLSGIAWCETPEAR